jgi:tetratricopeptide (TPR) repeat protein
MNSSTRTEPFGKAKIFVFALALSAASLPSLARAQAPTDVSKAETYASEAFEAYSNKDYQEAVVLYLKALEAAPSADVLFNLAKIYDSKLNDRELAMKFYRRYIADPGAEPERVRQANTRLAELRELELAASEKPAAVAATTAQPQTSGSGGDQTSLPPSRDRDGLTGMQWAGIATGLVGLGGVAVGTVFGFSAKSDADKAKQQCDGNACRTQSGVDAAEDASSKATISTVGFAAGGALTVVGAILLLAGGSSGPAERDTARLSIIPYAGRGSVGTQLSGRF